MTNDAQSNCAVRLRGRRSDLKSLLNDTAVYVPKARKDYLRLVRRVTTYTGELLSEAGYMDDQPAEAEVTA